MTENTNPDALDSLRAIFDEFALKANPFGSQDAATGKYLEACKHMRTIRELADADKEYDEADAAVDGLSITDLFRKERAPEFLRLRAADVRRKHARAKFVRGAA